jgi:hypothetical protein
MAFDERKPPTGECYLIFRSPKYLRAAKNQACIRCANNDGTVVAAHFFGVFRHRLGGGMGHKVGDHCTADLCSTCHAFFDNYETPNDYERAAEFLVMILKTIERRLNQGVLKC